MTPPEISRAFSIHQLRAALEILEQKEIKENRGGGVENV